ncbi:MAG: BMC domain-containing protein [Elusimicrobia bacterium]|nr:BMC domain-containing protein [Elusimicrobiota bacterium]
MQSIGLIETKGLTAMVEAADIMVKSADVEIVGYQKIGAGYVTVIVKGQVAACRSACEAGSVAAEKVGELVSVHVIPRPHDDLKNKLPVSKEYFNLRKKG